MKFYLNSWDLLRETLCWKNFLDRASEDAIIDAFYLCTKHYKTLRDKKSEMIEDGIRAIDVVEQSETYRIARLTLMDYAYLRFGIALDYGSLEKSDKKFGDLFGIYNDWVESYEF